MAQVGATTRQSCHCWSHRRGGRVLSIHQGGGEPLRPMPLEITRYLRVSGAELSPPPPPPVRRGLAASWLSTLLGPMVKLATVVAGVVSCRLLIVSDNGRRGRYPRHVLAPRLGRLCAPCAPCRACGRPSRERTPPSSRHPGRLSLFPSEM
jgi:hypothetical protein